LAAHTLAVHPFRRLYLVAVPASAAFVLALLPGYHLLVVTGLAFNDQKVSEMLLAGQLQSVVWVAQDQGYCGVLHILFLIMDFLRELREKKIEALGDFKEVYPQDERALKMSLKVCGGKCLEFSRKNLGEEEKRCLGNCIWKLGQVLSRDL
jgi:hypothetical protein